MTSYNHLVFESGGVRSTRFPRRSGDPRAILTTGRWPSGESLNGSDAMTLAQHLRPDAPGRRSKALRVYG